MIQLDIGASRTEPAFSTSAAAGGVPYTERLA